MNTKTLVYDNHSFDDFVINNHECRIIFSSIISISCSGHSKLDGKVHILCNNAQQ